MAKFNVYTVDSYIKKYHQGEKGKFAKAQGIPNQKVSVWIRGGWLMINGKPYSPRKGKDDRKQQNLF